MILFKITGCILILAASTMAGFELAGKYPGRIKDLNEMKKALTFLKEEIRFALTPFGEAALAISQRVEAPASEIFRRAGEAAASRKMPEMYLLWEYAVKEEKNTFYVKEDIAAFLSLGKTLGRLDKDMQTQSIDLLLEYIDGAVNKINENKDKESRMYKSLGVLSGLLIIVVMM